MVVDLPAWAGLAAGMTAAHYAFGKPSPFGRPWGSQSEKISVAAPAAMRKYRRGSRSGTRKRKRGYRRRFYGRRRRTGTAWSVTRRLRVCTIYSADLAAGGGMTVKQLKLNSVSDPSGDIEAVQPLGADQYAAFYKKTQVLGYSIKIEVVSNDNTYPVVVGFTPLADSTALTSWAHYCEQPGTVHRLCTMDMDKTIMFHSAGIRKYLSNGGPMLSDDLLQATPTSDPTRLLYGHLWAQEIGTSADAGLVRMIVTLTQIVKYFDPTVLARS